MSWVRHKQQATRSESLLVLYYSQYIIFKLAILVFDTRHTYARRQNGAVYKKLINFEQITDNLYYASWSDFCVNWRWIEFD